MSLFELHSPFSPRGDQQKAISQLTDSFLEKKKSQVLLGITGSGKTFTMAHVIQNLGKPSLVLAHNKTLAAQLYREFKSFFPKNAVEYFVSYYDFYQPEAYIARTDTYIEKDFAINDAIDQMRLSATRSLLERQDVIIISSVSCIYGLGTPEYYGQMVLSVQVGQKVRRDDLLLHLVRMHYKRNDLVLSRTSFRARGDVLEVVPAEEDSVAYRIEFFGDEIERISSIDPITGKKRGQRDSISLYPGSHHVTPEEVRFRAIETIKGELEERLATFEAERRELERQRLKERTLYDIEMIRETGFCKGIENYSRHFSSRKPGEPPPCLLDYFPKDFLLLVDESHQTLPQLHAMYNGDRARKHALIEFGFRLPSAYDNRPLKFEEFYQKIDQILFVSATPGQWEISEAQGGVVEQILRPTGLLDPIIEIHPAINQVEDVMTEIRKEIELGGRVLVATLTKKLSESLSSFLNEMALKAKYLHADIDTLERIRIIREFRLGTFDVLIGINLLREGIDIPEISLVAILDADKEGFLRSDTSLIQMSGRAARNERGRVIFYADKTTSSIQTTVAITEERRKVQQAFNEAHGIIPRSVSRSVEEGLEETFGLLIKDKEKKEEILLTKEILSEEDLEKKIRECKDTMLQAAKDHRFEEAAQLRNLLHSYEQLEIEK